MFWSMAPLVLVCIVLAGVLGMCSFAPNGPGPGPAARLRRAGGAAGRRRGAEDPDPAAAAARRLAAELRRPRQASTAGRTDPAGQPARAVISRVGYLAPTGMFISLTQSNADEAELIRSIDPDLVPTGTQDVDGVRWIVYEGGEDARAGVDDAADRADRVRRRSR